jgi:23S rRNA U2552 (ribose-2'-O)-methylase RlmE/FtsJ
MPYYQSEAEQQESLARSLEQLQQIQKDKNAVAKGDTIIQLDKLAN